MNNAMLDPEGNPITKDEEIARLTKALTDLQQAVAPIASTYQAYEEYVRVRREAGEHAQPFVRWAAMWLDDGSFDTKMTVLAVTYSDQIYPPAPSPDDDLDLID